MDTILASIRRILNEDEVAPVETVPDKPDKREPAPAAAAPPAGPDKDDVLVMGKAMMVPPEKTEPAPPASVVPAIPQPPAPIVPNPALVEGLIAARTRAATTQSFEALHEAMLREQPPPPAPPAASSPHLLRSGGPTLEDLVRDELRGLISNWLDEHLPRLVEALVRSEIEKLTRRPG